MPGKNIVDRHSRAGSAGGVNREFAKLHDPVDPALPASDLCFLLLTVSEPGNVLAVSCWRLEQSASLSKVGYRDGYRFLLVKPGSRRGFQGNRKQGDPCGRPYYVKGMHKMGVRCFG